MAKYDISQEGISKLTQLKSDLKSSIDHIDQSGQTLISTINGLSDELGNFADGINDVTQQVKQQQEPAKEAVNQLSAKIDTMIDKIQALLASTIS